MKQIQKLPKNFNKQLLKYFVSQNGSYETLNFEEKEFTLMQAHAKIYNLQFYLWVLFSTTALTFILRFLIINNY